MGQKDVVYDYWSFVEALGDTIKEKLEAFYVKVISTQHTCGEIKRLVFTKSLYDGLEGFGLFTPAPQANMPEGVVFRARGYFGRHLDIFTTEEDGFGVYVVGENAVCRIDVDMGGFFV